MLKTGDRVPDVSLIGQGGREVQLRELLGRGTLVLYFYPRDETVGCTAEACSFRDAYEDFVAAGAEVVGISADPAESHQAFAAHHRLPFTLLSDPDGEARGAFGVRSSFLGMIPGRVTFVIDATGVIRHTFDSQVLATKHVDEALKVVRQLAATPPAAHLPAERRS
jgi:thioredoxin-dependent peroxiredoxin